MPNGLQEIGEKALCCCASLSKITLPEGLYSIGPGAFSNCHKLTTIQIPSTVTSVGIAAFIECSLLKEVIFCEGGNSDLKIGSQAFYDCPSLTKMTVPSTARIDVGTFRGCRNLTEIHLSDGIMAIERDAFKECLSLLSINIPASVFRMHEYAFENRPHLRNVAISPHSDVFIYRNNGPGALDALNNPFPAPFFTVKGRWKDYGVSLHALCFFHARQGAEAIEYNYPMKWLDEHSRDLSSKDYSEEDCLRMTPLHVLACSGTHDINLYRRIIDCYPDAMIATDDWGETPLGYIMLSAAPMDLLHFFFNMHKQEWGCLPFDFGKMINRLKLYKSAEFIRQCIYAQRTYFPELEVNWQEIVEDSMILFDKYESVFRKTPITVFRVLVEDSVSSRPVCMSIEDQRTIDNWISKLMMIQDNPSKYVSAKQLNKFVHRIQGLRNREIPLDFDRLVGYSEKSRIELFQKCQGFVIKSVKLHEEMLQCASNTIELALWKATLSNSSEHGRQKGDESSRMESCLVVGKMCQVIIPNVLPYL